MTPVIEVGGSHATAALVDRATGRIDHQRHVGLDPAMDADALLDAVAGLARSLPAPSDATWGIAIPGPFDYTTGIGRFRDVGKFESLDGVDVGAELAARIGHPGGLRFVNDAAAFGLGESRWGAGAGHRRSVAITLGTGLGSAFLADGELVTAGDSVPPEGFLHLATFAGRPLEETVSTRALLASYHARGGGSARTVAAVASLAAAGDETARAVFADTYRCLGYALAEWIERFRPSVVVVGGGITRAWALVRDPLVQGLAEARSQARELPVLASADTLASALRGAALAASADALSRPAIRRSNARRRERRLG